MLLLLFTSASVNILPIRRIPAAVKLPADQPSSADQSSLARQLPPRQRPRTLAESSEEDKDGDSEFDVAAELAAFDSNDEFDELPGLKRR